MACSSFRALLFWCRGVLLHASVSSSRWADKIKKTGKVRKPTFFLEFRRPVRHFFGAILGPIRPSVPCCFGAGRCSCYAFVSSSSSNGCFGAGRCFWAAAAGKLMGDWKSGKGWEKNIFSRNSDRTLGTFSVRFCGLFVLPCLAVLVPGGALATLLLAAAAGGLMGLKKRKRLGKRHFF